MADISEVVTSDFGSASRSILTQGARELGITLSSEQWAQFKLFQAELLEWNQRVNLTSITEPAQVQSRHFLDSLTTVGVIAGTNDPAEVRSRIVDIGAGGGLPGIPLAIVLPRSRVVLVEATQKKCKFLEHAVLSLGLQNVEVACGRAEDLAQQFAFRATFDVAVVRALAALPTLVELALPFVRIGGKLIAMKKLDIDAEIQSAGQAVNLVGGRFGSPAIVNLPGMNEKRQLVIVDKVKATPRDYPRRDGLPGKTPLGSGPNRPAGLSRQGTGTF